MTKRCFKCLKIKSLDDFYAHPQMKDSHLNKCKECAKKDVRENYDKRRDQYLEYDKGRANLPHRVKARQEYMQTEAGKQSHALAVERYNEQNPERKTAVWAVNNAVRDGRLKKEPCFYCGSTRRIHGHHEDYSKPLDVKWVCAKHHKMIHRGEL